jgi:hypothetical protein
MNFLKKCSKKAVTHLSTNNSAEKNSNINKPPQSTANTTTTSDDSSIDQSSLDLLAPTPPFASTSHCTINNKIQVPIDRIYVGTSVYTHSPCISTKFEELVQPGKKNRMRKKLWKSCFFNWQQPI